MKAQLEASKALAAAAAAAAESPDAEGAGGGGGTRRGGARCTFECLIGLAVLTPSRLSHASSSSSALAVLIPSLPSHTSGRVFAADTTATADAAAALITAAACGLWG